MAGWGAGTCNTGAGCGAAGFAGALARICGVTAGSTACLAQVAALPVTRLNRFGARRGWAAAGCTGVDTSGAGAACAGAGIATFSTGGGAT